MIEDFVFKSTYLQFGVNVPVIFSELVAATYTALPVIPVPAGKVKLFLLIVNTPDEYHLFPIQE